MKRNIILFIIIFSFLLFVPVCYSLAASNLKIGVAKVKITPEEPTILAGYLHDSGSLCNPSTDILDDIYCRIMVVEDGSGNREVFLSMDVCVYMESDYYDPYNGIGVWWPKTVPAGTTQRFADAGNVDINKVFVSATHTHQASEQLADKYIQRIIDGINAAKNNMVAVNVGYANTLYDINVNRRPDFGIHPNMECDKSLVVAIFRNASSGIPVASIVNYAIHNTGIGVGGNGYNKCSSELTGIAMNNIESSFGNGFVSLFFQGYLGDVGPNIEGSPGATYSKIVSIGNAFGQDCKNILNNINVNSNPVAVNGITSSLSLPTKPGWGVSSQGVNFAAARIGDICFIGGSGEIFNQMGISLRLQSPFGAIVTAALVNGYSGYVPTYSGFNDGVGGPEVTTKSPWSSNIENIYMTEMSKLVSSMVGGSSTLGYSSVGGNSESSVANTLIISKCNAGANMTLSNLRIYVQNATGKVRMGLYADNGTDSPYLLQQTGEITLTDGWNEGAIQPTNIEPGTYWIGFIFNNSGNIVYSDLRKLGSYLKNYVYDSMPSNPSEMTGGAEMYSVYAGNSGTTVPISVVNVSPTSASIYVNHTQQLTASVAPSNATNKSVIWSSDNTEVATVDSNGLVTALAAGSATITVTTQDGAKTASCNITVSIPTPVTGISVSPASISISIDVTQQLTATVAPSNATNKAVSWSSDNNAVATVDNNGLVTALATGSATITVTTQDGAKTASCNITVSSGDGSTIGLNTVGELTENGINGNWIVSSFTALSNSTVNRINLYVSNASGNARLGLYSSSSGEPGDLLAQTDEISLNNGWNSGTLGSSQNLISGETYWLAFEVSSSATTLHYNSVSGRQRYKSYSYGSLPSPAPINCFIGTGIYSIYADNSSSIMVTAVSVSPTSASLTINDTQQLTATVSPSNATNKSVSWSSNNTAVATVDSNGLVTALATGSATITVITQDGAKTASCNITVSSGDESTIGLNTVGELTENGINGNWIGISFTALSNSTVNRINLYVSNASGNARLGLYSSSSGEPGDLLAQTDEISLNNGWNSGTLGSSQNLISGETYWLAFEVSSSATTLHYNSVPGRQRYKSYSYGSLPSPAPINCFIGTGIYSIYADNSSSIMVTAVSVGPTSVSLTISDTQQLTASVEPSNATNKAVSWSSDNTAVATVDSNGLVTALAIGSATITVTTLDGARTASCNITVSSSPIAVTAVTVNPNSANLTVNGSQQLTASVTPSNATNKALSWSSNNTAVATVDSNGLVTALATGSATITVTTLDGAKTASCNITVSSSPIAVTAVTVNPNSANLTVNGSQQLTASVEPSNATNKAVSWSSDNTAVATVDSNGLVTALATGSATITVTTLDGAKTASCNITVSSSPIAVTAVTVNPNSANLTVNGSQQLTASVEPSNATNKALSWSSDNTAVATVDSNGLVTALATGSATITVTTLDGAKTASCNITVNIPTLVTGISVSPASASIYVNYTQQLTASVEPSNATNKAVSWSSDNTAVATVDSNGLVTALATGSATITVITLDGAKTASCNITVSSSPIAVTAVTVNPNSANLTVNGSQQLTASVEPSNATNKALSWSSDNTAVATVDSNGLVTALATGSATITVTTLDGAKTASCNITVSSSPIAVTAVTVNPNSANLTVNGSQQLTASVEPSNATNKALSWSSDNTAVATVDSNGLVTALATGSATITVTTLDGAKTASCNITVSSSPIAVTAVTVNPNSANLTVNGSQQLTASVEPSNATNKALSWSSDNTAVATVDSNGLVTALATGSATITVTTLDGAKTASCNITVNSSPIAVTAVTVNPNSANLTVNGSQQLTASVEPSNATNKAVSWSSDNTAVATVDNNGLVTALATGSATITVITQDGAKTASCNITVSSGDESTIGLDTVGELTENGINGNWIGISFTALSNSTVNRINLYVSNASGNARLGLYSSSSGEPGDLLAQTDEISLNNGWNSGTLDSSQSLISGETYWLAFEVNSSATTLHYNSVPGRQRYKSYSYGSLPSPAPINCFIGTGIYSIYADNNSSIMVTAVSVSATSASLTINDTQQLTATVEPSNATNKAVSWSSDNTAVATVDSNGLVTALATGSATITVTTLDGAKTASCNITVSSSPIAVTAVTVNPNSANLTVNGSQQLTASVTPSNATNKALSWSSNNTAVATVDSNGLVTALATGSATITVTTLDGAKTASCNITVSSSPIAVTAVTVNPNSANLTVNGSQQLTASVEPSNATNKAVSWSSNNNTVATVDNNGLVTALATGSATITVTTLDGAKTASCNITVSSSPIAVTAVTVNPNSANLTVNGSQQLTASVTPSNATNKAMSWSSDNNAVATVDSNGLVTALATGSATITVTTLDGAKTASCNITVSSSAYLGYKVNGLSVDGSGAGDINASQFTASSSFTASTMYVSMPAVNAKIKGAIYSDNSGTPGSMLGETSEITNPSVEGFQVLTGLNVSIINGTKYWLVVWGNAAYKINSETSGGIFRWKASQTYGSWPSTFPVTDGSANLKYSIYVDGIANLVTGVSVTPISANLTVNGSQQLTASVTPSNATNKAVSWSSDNNAVATVDSNGLVTALATGSATITVTTLDGAKTASCNITVSSSPIAVTAVTVNPNSANLTVNGSQQLTASVTPSNATNKAVSWSSDNNAVATVDSNGLVTALATGSATITVTTLDGAKTASCNITISSSPIAVTAVSVNPNSANLTVNGSQQLTASVEPSNATNKAVSWSSNNTAVATVDSNGLVTALATGSATITVTTLDGAKTASCNITVSSSAYLGYKVNGLSVDGSGAGDINASQFTASSSFTASTMYVSMPAVNAKIKGAIYSDNSGTPGSMLGETSEITNPSVGGFQVLTGLNVSIINGTKYWLVVWGNAAYKINSETSGGIFRWKASQTYGSWPSTFPVTDGSANLKYSIYVDGIANLVTGVSVTPISANLTVNGSQQLTASVTPSNATNKAVSWSSDNNAVATVDSNGLVTALATGSATITVTTLDGAKTASCNITVSSSPIAVTAVTVNPNSANLTVNGSQQLTASVTPSNATNKAVSWSSDNNAVATVDSNGLVTALATGSATITVTTLDGAKTASCNITISSSPIAVTAVSVNPNSANLTVNGSQQLTASVEPSNATNKAVSWSSNNTAVATVDSNGLVTALATGSATITVTTLDGAKTASCNITVNSSAYLGYKVNGLSVDGSGAGDINASQFTASSSFTASTMYVSMPAVNAKIKGAIYSDNSGTPGSMLGETSEITNPSVGGFQVLTGLNVSIINGTKYWLVVWGNAAYKINSETSGGIFRWKASQTYGPWPSTFPVTDGSANLKYSIYVDGIANLVTGVSVTPISANLTVNGSQQLTASVTPSNATNKAVSWSSDNNAVATVDSNGLVTALATGSATITVTTLDGAKTASCNITVSSSPIAVTAVTVNPNSANLTVNGSQQLTASVTPSNATNKAVSWSSDNNAVATVDSNGLVTALATGSATITVTTLDGAKTASCNITISSSPIAVTAVSVNPNSANLTVNGSQQLTASVEPSNATNKAVSWSSNNTAVATVDSNGLVTALATGSATITVTTLDGAKTASCNITVNSSAYLGYKVNGLSVDGSGAGDINASQFTASSSFTASTMYVSMPAVNAKIKGAIYSDNSGTPGSMLGETSEITNPSVGGFQVLTGLNVSIINGTKYWLVVWGNAAYKINSETSGGIFRWKASQTYGPWPSTFPVTDGSANLKYSIYVDGIALKSANSNESNTMTNASNSNQNPMIVYPNPVTNGVIYIDFASTTESATVYIVNLTGQIILRKTFYNYSGTQQLDISNINRGIYLINATQGNKYYTKKFIIK